MLNYIKKFVLLFSFDRLVRTLHRHWPFCPRDFCILTHVSITKVSHKVGALSWSHTFPRNIRNFDDSVVPNCQHSVNIWSYSSTLFSFDSL